MVSLLSWIEAHPGLAGWIQAIGSLLALAVAIVLPRLDRAAREREAVLLARRRIEEALDELQAVAATLHFSASLPFEKGGNRAMHDEVSGQRKRLEALPFESLPPRLTMPLHEFVRRFAAAEQALDLDSPDTPAFFRIQCQLALKHLRATRLLLRERLADFQAALNVLPDHDPTKK